MSIKGRKPTAVATVDKPEIDTDAVNADLIVASQGHQATLRRMQDSALDVGRLAGRIESMLFQRTVADRVIAEAFIQLRESKKYKDLLIDDGNGNRRPVADLEEACAYLFGKSNRTCRELAQNYESLGGELYDKAQQIGLHTRDYRALRALPSDDQVLVQQAIESATDREAVTELLMELTERHAKKALKLQEDLAAKEARAARDAERINALEDENARLTTTQPLGEEALLRELADHALKVVAEVEAGLRSRFAGLAAHFEARGGEVPNHVCLAEQQALTQVMQAARVLAADFGVALAAAEVPQELAWMYRPELLDAVPAQPAWMDAEAAPAATDLDDTEV